jgi:DNA-directed RNA polymerase subunit RPC12/RpoP
MLYPSVHVKESYRCDDCRTIFHLTEVRKDWKCADCNIPISIKREIDHFVHSCHRFLPGEIEPDMSVSFDGNFIRTVIAVKVQGDQYTIALKEYGVKVFNNKDYVLVVDGAWIE